MLQTTSRHPQHETQMSPYQNHLALLASMRLHSPSTSTKYPNDLNRVKNGPQFAHFAQTGCTIAPKNLVNGRTKKKKTVIAPNWLASLRPIKLVSPSNFKMQLSNAPERAQSGPKSAQFGQKQPETKVGAYLGLSSTKFDCSPPLFVISTPQNGPNKHLDLQLCRPALGDPIQVFKGYAPFVNGR